MQNLDIRKHQRTFIRIIIGRRRTNKNSQCNLNLRSYYRELCAQIGTPKRLILMYLCLVLFQLHQRPSSNHRLGGSELHRWWRAGAARRHPRHGQWCFPSRCLKGSGEKCNVDDYINLFGLSMLLWLLKRIFFFLFVILSRPTHQTGNGVRVAQI